MCRADINATQVVKIMATVLASLEFNNKKVKLPFNFRPSNRHRSKVASFFILILANQYKILKFLVVTRQLDSKNR